LLLSLSPQSDNVLLLSHCLCSFISLACLPLDILFSLSAYMWACLYVFVRQNSMKNTEKEKQKTRWCEGRREHWQADTPVDLGKERQGRRIPSVLSQCLFIFLLFYLLTPLPHQAVSAAHTLSLCLQFRLSLCPYKLWRERWNGRQRERERECVCSRENLDKEEE
jgi:hypothetical protein